MKTTKNYKLAFKLWIKTYLLKNDDEFCIPSLSSILSAVTDLPKSGGVDRPLNPSSTALRIIPSFLESRWIKKKRESSCHEMSLQPAVSTMWWNNFQMYISISLILYRYEKLRITNPKVSIFWATQKNYYVHRCKWLTLL